MQNSLQEVEEDLLLENSHLQKSEFFLRDVHFSFCLNFFSLPSPPGSTQPDTQPPKGERPPPSGSTEGYFHIYQTTRDLTNLLYIDGLSAGKSRIGTLDSTDYLLRSLKPGQDSPMSERERASDLCSLSPSIEGIIRMEAGFELILCDFENGLELDQVIKRPKMSPKESHGPGGPGGMTGNLQQFEYARGVSNRYDGIGDGRIRADFSHMITAFWFGLNFTANNKSPEGDLSLPRLVNSDPEELRKVKDVVISSFETPRNQSEPSIDWQGITDMIIARYANRLKYLESNKISLEKTREELDFLLNVYIDYSNPNQTIDQSIALEKCSNHYLKSVTPKTRTDFLLKSSILNVTSTICSSLFSMREDLSTSSASSSSLKHQLQLKVSSLNAWLSWAEWLKCGRCSYDEICYVAIWPWGSKEDHFKPSCSRAEDRRNGYWEGREW